jgi:phosphohistidine swiveling domain-containing protein
MPEPDQAQAMDPSHIAWDCPEDAHLTWIWNKQAFPEPLTPPDFLGAPPAPQEWVDRYEGPPIPLKAKRGEIRGAGASPGSVRGVARVAHRLEEGLTLKRGEILVCVAADPNWTPLFALAAALVTDAGGSLCHAAVVAREYGIPAVVGTHSASRVFADGQLVEVDGAAGIVRLI